MWLAITSPLHQLPAWYIYSFAFMMGGLIGSFLNVCILRIPEEGVSIFYPRNSRCPSCETTLRWYDNIPVLSWLSLRGRCRYCETSISVQYPLIELLTAIMAVAAVKKFGPSLAALAVFAFICALIVITFIDMAYWIIPDVISLPGIPLGIITVWALGPPLPTWQDAALGALIGGGIFFAISFGYEIILKRPGLGMGDVKLLAMIGAFLGWQALPAVILLASTQGLLTAIVLFFFGVRQEVPEFEEDFEDEEDEDAEEQALDADESEGDAPTPAEAKEAETSKEIETPKETQAAAIGAPKASDAEATEAADDIGEDEEDEEAVGFRAVAIQFGPFLCLAAIETLFWGKEIAYWWLKLIRQST